MHFNSFKIDKKIIRIIRIVCRTILYSIVSTGLQIGLAEGCSNSADIHYSPATHLQFPSLCLSVFAGFQIRVCDLASFKVTFIGEKQGKTTGHFYQKHKETLISV